jgi:hypothetical protein
VGVGVYVYVFVYVYVRVGDGGGGARGTYEAEYVVTCLPPPLSSLPPPTLTCFFLHTHTCSIPLHLHATELQLPLPHNTPGTPQEWVTFAEPPFWDSATKQQALGTTPVPI